MNAAQAVASLVNRAWPIKVHPVYIAILAEALSSGLRPSDAVQFIRLLERPS